jgi:hypothetical protein
LRCTKKSERRWPPSIGSEQTRIMQVGTGVSLVGVASFLLGLGSRSLSVGILRNALGVHRAWRKSSASIAEPVAPAHVNEPHRNFIVQLPKQKLSAEKQNPSPRRLSDDIAHRKLISPVVSSRCRPDGIRRTPIARTGLLHTPRRSRRRAASHRHVRPFLSAAGRLHRAKVGLQNP